MTHNAATLDDVISFELQPWLAEKLQIGESSGAQRLFVFFARALVEPISWGVLVRDEGGAMSLAILYSSNALFRATLKTLAFGLSSFVAIFCASAGYGLLKMLLSAMSSGANIGIAEFSTHSGLTIIFFVLAGISAYVAKKCFG